MSASNETLFMEYFLNFTKKMKCTFQTKNITSVYKTQNEPHLSVWLRV